MCNIIQFRSKNNERTLDQVIKGVTPLKLISHFLKVPKQMCKEIWPFRRRWQSKWDMISKRRKRSIIRVARTECVDRIIRQKICTYNTRWQPADGLKLSVWFVFEITPVPASAMPPCKLKCAVPRYDTITNTASHIPLNLFCKSNSATPDKNYKRGFGYA
jgi:hypothetical protein